MKRVLTFAAIALLIIAGTAPAFPMAAEYRNDEPLGGPDWPKGLAELLTSSQRVYGYWVNSIDHFYYAGDTAAVNSFLRRFARVDVGSRVLVVQPGRGKVKSLVGGDQLEYDWEVTRSAWGSPMPGQRLPECVEMQLFVGGQVQLENAIIPSGIDVMFGGDISAEAISQLRPPLGRRQVEGKLRWKLAMPLLMGAGAGSERNIVRLLSARFDRSDAGVAATVHGAMLSWPKGKWTVQIELLDSARRRLAAADATFENNGIVRGIPSIQEGDLRLALRAAAGDLARASIFRISIGEAAAGAGTTYVLQ